jgi:cystathionine beta-lyase
MKKKPETIITHSGRNPKANYGVVNPPVYHVSTVIFEKYADFKKSWQGVYPGITYGRHGTESHKELERVLSELELSLIHI